MSSSLQLLLVLLLAGAAVMTIVITLWDPISRFSQARLGAYLERLDDQLKALFKPFRGRDFAIRQAGLMGFGIVIGLALGSIFFSIGLAVFFFYAPIVWLEREKIARRKALEAQLDATLQSLANTILVTQNLDDAFSTIAEHFDPPISQEADILVKQVRLGTPMEQALQDFAVRCGSRNVDALITALTVGRQTGGELPKVLETTASVMRETMRVEGVMEAKTSEGKAQMWVMSMLPFLFGGALQIVDPDWMAPLFKDPIGWVVLGVAGTMWLVGVALTRRVTQMEV